MRKIVLNTPAKVNLGLQVGRERSDGYHEVRTIYQTIDICDRLKISKSKLSEEVLDVSGGRYAESIPNDSSNILLKTLSLLRENGFDIPLLKIELEKNIPVEAGLGGGSSDAAALLRAIKLLTDDERLTSTRILKVASEIGSDVPFFLRGGTMLGKGRGNLLKPVSDIMGTMILVVPPYSSSTEETYDSLHSTRGTFDDFGIELSDPRNKREITDTKINLSNDFSSVLEERQLHRDVVNKLEEWSDYVGVTGSGSSIYALFSPDQSLTTLKRFLANELSECEVYTSQLIGSDQMPQMGRMELCQSR